ncbi:MAG: ribose 5-phosphate isomerase B [Firmicutes bacterium]|jgi:ribose 5-phosphate isomerase B|nr:ribose 5-phosphate isomerase B [Bacillota bacterium]
MRIAVGSDHLGLPLKKFVMEVLNEQGIEYVDMGCYSEEPVDYPDIGEKVAVAVADGQFDRGILICGTGIGMCIVANKVPGVRAALAHDVYSAERARKSNDAQILTMGAQVVGTEAARAILNAWLASEFQGGRSAPKVAKMAALDTKYRKQA